MPTSPNPLLINVGFIVHADIGYTRQFDIALDSLSLEEGSLANNINGLAKFSRTQSGLLLEIDLTAHTIIECGRCLDSYSQELQTSFTELYAFDKRNVDESSLILPDDRFIDLAPLVQDFLRLAIPINPICKSECAGLCPICGINHNHKTCDCEIDQIDPRLASLKDLLDKEE